MLCEERVAWKNSAVIEKHSAVGLHKVIAASTSGVLSRREKHAEQGVSVEPTATDPTTL